MRKLATESSTHRAMLLKDGFSSLRFTRSLYSHHRIESTNNPAASEGTCINCVEKPCWVYSKAELNPKILNGLPYSTSKEVCPTQAISTTNRGIKINPNSCLGCGICSSRCPIGGISLNPERFTAQVNQQPSDLFEEFTTDSLPKLSNVTSKILFWEQEDYPIRKGHSNFFHSRLASLKKVNTDLTVTVVRNFCLSLNIPCKVRASGNHDNRIDFIARDSSTFILGIVNLRTRQKQEILESVRRILDNMATLFMRHNIALQHQTPLLFIEKFPNKRTDFYEVLRDISKVLEIEVRIISVHHLFCLLNLGGELTPDFLSQLVLSDNNLSLQEKFKSVYPKIEAADPEFNGSFYGPLK